MLQIALIEENEADRQALHTLIERCAREAHGGECTVHSFADSDYFVENYRARYDVIFFNYTLPLLSCLHAAARLRELDPSVPVILVTNFIGGAINGYSLNASACLMKPVAYDQLRSCLTRALAKKPREAAHNLYLHSGSNVRVIPYDSLLYVREEDGGLTLSTVFGTVGLKNVDEKFSEIRPVMLKYGNFAQCSEDTVININKITEIKGGFAYLGNTPFEVKKGYKARFRAAVRGRKDARAKVLQN